jgi:hypothetical protein
MKKLILFVFSIYSLLSFSQDLVSTTPSKENATISISNLLGKEVIALNNIISNNTSIDISSLKNGIYFVNTNLKGSITTEKIVILK